MFDRVFGIDVKSNFYIACTVLPVHLAKIDGVILKIRLTASIISWPSARFIGYSVSGGRFQQRFKSIAIELASNEQLPRERLYGGHTAGKRYLSFDWRCAMCSIWI